MNTKHEFALYVPTLSALLRSTKNDVLILHDADLATRIGSVLRLKADEALVLFDLMVHVRCSIRAVQKKSVEFIVIEVRPNVAIKPSIICLLPLLKRDDLEIALYAAVELGATSVQLMMTHKVQRTWGGEKEFDRLQRVMIAAAEQSKNFAIPRLFAPVLLSEILPTMKNNSAKIYFDADGQPLVSVVQPLSVQPPREIVLMVGPEGDLLAEEKELLRHHNFTFCTLTPTVVRSVTAFGLGLGIIRSILR